jgi:hypothetical protein
MSVRSRLRWFLTAIPAMAVVFLALTASAVDEDFPTLTKRVQAEKPTFAKRQQALLAERYDLATGRPMERSCHAARRCRRACASSSLRT